LVRKAIRANGGTPLGQLVTRWLAWRGRQRSDGTRSSSRNMLEKDIQVFRLDASTAHRHRSAQQAERRRDADGQVLAARGAVAAPIHEEGRPNSTFILLTSVGKIYKPQLRCDAASRLVTRLVREQLGRARCQGPRTRGRSSRHARAGGAAGRGGGGSACG
jgi:hypothetical protein